jgi:hypothetical protein
MGFGRVRYGDELVFIQGYDSVQNRWEGSGIRGVQSIDAEFNIPFEPIAFGGNMFAGTVLNGSKATSSFTIDSLVVTEASADPLVYLFDKVLSGALNWDGLGTAQGNYSFESGFISTYSSSCAVGEIPSLTCSIDVYGEVGNFAPTELFPESGKIPDDEIKIAKAGDIKLINVTGNDTNRIQSYSYELSIPRMDIDTLGGEYQRRIYDITYPIEVDLSFVIDVDDLETPLLSSLLCNQDIPDITIQLSGCQLENNVRTFKITDPILVSINESSAISEELQAKISYKSYIKDVNLLPSLIF